MVIKVNITKDSYIMVNTNNITALVSEKTLDNKYLPTIVVLPGGDRSVYMANAPFDTQDECLAALKELVTGGTE